tara:strand:+ start:1565 stop:2011 length:447 start_codon:yes stop_codon:yes gene_type:complete
MLKLISRQNMAVLATICIIGVLCNPHYFDSILDTYQGRIILVGLIILLSYENPVLGTIVVLFIAIKTTNVNEALTTEDKYSDPHPTLKPSLKPSQEGFDVIGTENNITRGKPSNSIPVTNKSPQELDIVAHEGFSNYKTYSEVHQRYI